MSFTKIPNKKGVFRHAATKFIVHEAYSIKDLVAANGVLAEYDNGYWIWMAGRDMRDFLQSRAVTDLSDVLTKLYGDNQALGTYNVINHDASNAAVYPMIVRAAAIITAKGGWPGTFTDTPYTSAKIFALVNNCHAGKGSGGTAKRNSLMSAPYDYTVGVFQGSAANITDASLRAGMSHDGPPGYNNSFKLAPDSAQLLGTVVIAVPLGVTWTKFVADLITKLPNSDQSEVVGKCHEKMDPMIPIVTAVNPVPMAYVPVEIISDGTYRVVRPKAGSRVTSSVYQHPETVRTVQVARGGVCFDERGVASTFDRWISPTLVYTNGGYEGATSFTHRHSDVLSMASYTGFSGSPVEQSNPEKTTFSDQVTSIDGIRLERILGGISGLNLSDTGEKDVASVINKTSTELIAGWRSALRFEALGSAFNRGADGNGVPETDTAYTSRLSGLASTKGVEDPLASRLTQWDHHGFSAAHGMLAFLAALDGETTDSKWITPLWPARQWIIPPWTPRQTGTHQAVATTATPISSLLPPVT